MRVELLRGLEPVIITGVTRVLVCWDDGTPASVSAEWMPGEIKTSYAGRDDFSQILVGLGIDRTVLVTRFTPRTAEEILSP